MMVDCLGLGAWDCGALGDHRHLPRRIGGTEHHQTPGGRLELPPNVRGHGPRRLHRSGTLSHIRKIKDLRLNYTK